MEQLDPNERILWLFISILIKNPGVNILYSEPNSQHPREQIIEALDKLHPFKQENYKKKLNKNIKEESTENTLIPNEQLNEKHLINIAEKGRNI